MYFGHPPKTHGGGKDAQTNMLAGAPTNVQGRNIYSSESHLWDRSKSCGGKAGLNGTDNMVKSIDDGTRDNIRDTSLLMVIRLQYSSGQLCKWKRV